MMWKGGTLFASEGVTALKCPAENQKNKEGMAAYVRDRSRSPRRGAPAALDGNDCKIYVGNLAFQCNADDIRNHFGQVCILVIGHLIFAPRRAQLLLSCARSPPHVIAADRARVPQFGKVEDAQVVMDREDPGPPPLCDPLPLQRASAVCAAMFFASRAPRVGAVAAVLQGRRWRCWCP